MQLATAAKKQRTIYDLKELIDIKDYAKWADGEIYRDFAKKLGGKQVAGM